MSANSIVKNALASYKENELILASKLYRGRLAEQISEATYYKVLERMCKAGELVKLAKSTYHLPKKSKYGLVPPSEKEIIFAFTGHETGTVIGYSLYNALNLTTQISKTVNVLSSELEGKIKSIRNVIVHQMPLVFSEDVKNMVHGLEVLQNFSTIQEINYPAFIAFAEQLASTYDGESFNKVISAKSYKKSTISFLNEILSYYGVKNNLSKHLSALSVYKHPKMEELYEAARIS